jgi:hypothetical protein
MSGTAASAALRRVTSLARFAPTHKAIEAIATLTEIGGRIDAALSAGDRALTNRRHREAVHKLSESLGLMDDMARIALAEPEIGALETRKGSAA